MRKTEIKKKKRQKAIWAGLGMRKVAMVTTRMARLKVRINTRLPRSQKELKTSNQKVASSHFRIAKFRFLRIYQFVFLK